MKPGFLHGLTFWLRGWRVLVGEPTLIMLSIIPFILAVTFAGVSFHWVVKNLPEWVHRLTVGLIGESSGFIQYLYYPLMVASGFLVLGASVYAAYFGLMLIAVPFYSLLAERTLSLIGAKPEEPFTFKRWLGKSWHMLRISLVKTVIFLCLGVMLFGLSFIPLINLLAMFCSLLILSFDLMDYSFEAMHFGFRRRLGFAAEHRNMWAGMAFGLGLTLFIPGLTLLIAPGAVVGAALLIKESVHGS